jgi:hypothetical protein
VRPVLVLRKDLGTQLDDVLRLVHIHDARVSLREPLAQSRLRTANDGSDIPQGVVEIQGYRAYAVHVLLATSQWTTIVIRFN